MTRYVRSGHGLTRCGACRAHVRAADTPNATECPFCEAPITRRAPRRTASLGRSALVAAGLASLTAGGCGGGDDAAGDDTATEPIDDDTTGGDTTGGDTTGGDTFDDGQHSPAVPEYGAPAEPHPEPMYGIAPE